MTKIENGVNWKDHYGVIYCLTCKINGKVYIGQTTNLPRRISRYKNLHCKSQPILYNALDFHKVENFNYEIIDTGTGKDQLDSLECYHMALAMCRDRNHGYNDKEGGANGSPSAETRKKQSDQAKGRKATPEAKAKMSKAKKGKKGHKQTEDAIQRSAKKRTGLKRSEESKLRMSECSKGRTQKEETKKKISEKLKGCKYSVETINKRIETRKRNKELINNKNILDSVQSI